MKIAINGFGRIGRLLLRGIYEYSYPGLDIVAINATSDPKTVAHLFTYDSLHGNYKGSVNVQKDAIDLGRGPIKILAERDPAKINWKDLGVDMVFECTGQFVTKEQAAVHLKAGAKKVMISAPGKEVDLTVVYGLNHTQITPQHDVVSSASCTTNCLAPLASVLHDTVGIEKGFMTTIHAYTGDQRLLDGTHRDLRRGRAAALSIVPTSTGAAKALGEVLPALKGKLSGTAMRVPVPNVSAVDLVFTSSRDTTAEELNDALKTASEGALKGVMRYCDVPLVSTDFNHDPHSTVVDSLETSVTGGNLCRVLAWYDNEWGFSMRMLDTAKWMAENITMGKAT